MAAFRRSSVRMSRAGVRSFAAGDDQTPDRTPGRLWVTCLAAVIAAMLFAAALIAQPGQPRLRRDLDAPPRSAGQEAREHHVAPPAVLGLVRDEGAETVEAVRVRLAGDGDVHELVAPRPHESFGHWVEQVGDVNGDGAPDLAVGAPRVHEGTDRPGRVYVYSGRDGALLRSLYGRSGERFARRIWPMGDRDRDGRADLAVLSVFSRAGGWLNGRITLFSGRTGEPLFERVDHVTPHERHAVGMAAAGRADLDGNGVVDSEDLRTLLGRFGTVGAAAASADLTMDGVVDAADLGVLMSDFGVAPRRPSVHDDQAGLSSDGDEVDPLTLCLGCIVCWTDSGTVTGDACFGGGDDSGPLNTGGEVLPDGDGSSPGDEPSEPPPSEACALFLGECRDLVFGEVAQIDALIGPAPTEPH